MKKDFLNDTIEMPKLKNSIDNLENTVIIELPKFKKVSFSKIDDTLYGIEMPMLKNDAKTVNIDNIIPNLENTILIELPKLKNSKKTKYLQFEKGFLKALSCICLVLIVFVSINLVKRFNNYRETNKIAEEVYDLADIVTEYSPEYYEEEVLKQDIKEDSDYFKYSNYSFLDVNFDELKRINNDTVGWIQVANTKVNYPFVKTSDNDYYLNHSFDKKKNSAGWVFMDYRNDINNLSQNTILYAHGLYNGMLFGSLKNTLNSSWYNKKDFTIKLSTENLNSNWEIFSVYKIPTTTDYLTTNFSSDEDYLNFLNMLKNRSEQKFDVELNKDDKILTLSTCYNHDIKMVVHAKLVSTN